MAPAGPTRPASEEVPLSDVAMVHLYRGELGRSDRWRTRLDATTNWAITTTAAVVSFGFSSPATPHVVLLVGVWMVTSFLLIEARRYRYYDLWIRRLRLLESGYWAPMLRREPADPDALKELALEMARPRIQLSLISALATRMNRIYGPILLVLLLSWLAKLYSLPSHPASLGEMVQRAHIGPVPGHAVMGVMVLFVLAAILVFVSAYISRPPMGEVRPLHRARKVALWEMFSRPYGFKAPRRLERKRPGRTTSGRP